jgi:preprotein translocase subunit SecY
LAANPNTVGKGGKFGDLKRRLWFLLGALVLSHWRPYPGSGYRPQRSADLFNSQKGGILGMFNMFSGGALSRFTIFALGIMPYISASIIMQLMSVPARTRGPEEGREAGVARSPSTRVTAPSSWLCSRVGHCRCARSAGWLVNDPGFMFRLTTVSTLLTGTMFLMWLGEQITERGLGNGISIIIFAVSQPACRMPSAVFLSWFAPVPCIRLQR